MKKFILLYKGPATPMDQMTEEQGQKQMQLWQAWVGKIGDALVDMGSPTGESQSVADDGSKDQPVDITGYSIIQAEDLESAVKLVEDHPFLSDKSGKFSVEVLELTPIQM